MATVTFAATDLDQIDDPQAMRALVLEQLAEQAETEHSRIVDLHGADAPTRLAAVIAVIDEASAYWTVEQHGPMTVGDYREIAADMHRVVTEQIPSIIIGRRVAG